MTKLAQGVEAVRWTGKNKTDVKAFHRDVKFDGNTAIVTGQRDVEELREEMVEQEVPWLVDGAAVRDSSGTVVTHLREVAVNVPYIKQVPKLMKARPGDWIVRDGLDWCVKAPVTVADQYGYTDDAA